MDTPAPSNWYTANFHYLQTAVNQVRQVLEDKINHRQNQPSPLRVERTLAPDALAILQNTPSALDKLCTLFSLSPFECHILLLCVGMELYDEFEQLCIKIHGNSDRNYPTLGIALSTFSNAHLSILSSQSPLQYWKLIEIEPGRSLSQSPIKINQRILCYLLGEPCLEDELSGILEPYPITNPSHIRLPPSHQKLADQLIKNWLQATQTRNFTVVQLCGPELTSKYAIATKACANLGFNLTIISVAMLPPQPNQLNDLKHQCLREAMLSNSALLLDCDQVNSADPSREFVISQFMSGLTVPVIISTQERIPQRQQLTITLEVNPPTHNEQRELWQSHLGSFADELNGQIDRLVSQFNLSPFTIQTACLSLNQTELENLSQSKEEVPAVAEPPPSSSRSRKSKSQKRNSQIEIDQSPIMSYLWDFCRSQARPHLADLAQRIEPAATWEDLILPDREKGILRDISLHLRQRSKVYQEWGFAGKGSRGLGISALFSGASGTGKTMSAEVLAQELQLDLYRIDLSAVVSKYIGETEKNLRRIFDAAETGGAILLFDEADALFGKRTQVKDSHDRHANVEVSYLLQRMEAYQGLAILTTNLKESLDQAFLRRIRFFVKFPFPDAESRCQIWQHIFPKTTPTKELNYRKLGNLNVAGGNIRNIAVNAAFIAADGGEPVMMKHILQATKNEYVKLEQTLTDIEVRGWV